MYTINWNDLNFEIEVIFILIRVLKKNLFLHVIFLEK